MCPCLHASAANAARMEPPPPPITNQGQTLSPRAIHYRRADPILLHAGNSRIGPGNGPGGSSVTCAVRGRLLSLVARPVSTAPSRLVFPELHRYCGPVSSKRSLASLPFGHLPRRTGACAHMAPTQRQSQGFAEARPPVIPSCSAAHNSPMIATAQAMVCPRHAIQVPAQPPTSASSRPCHIRPDMLGLATAANTTDSRTTATKPPLTTARHELATRTQPRLGCFLAAKRRAHPARITSEAMPTCSPPPKAFSRIATQASPHTASSAIIRRHTADETPHGLGSAARGRSTLRATTMNASASPRMQNSIQGRSYGIARRENSMGVRWQSGAINWMAPVWGRWGLR